jgi:PKD repeat protein
MKHVRIALTLCIALSMSLSALAHKRPDVEYQENKGQWEPAVRFRAGLGTGTVFLENNRFAFSFFSAADLDVAHEYSRAPWLFAEEPTIHGHAWYLKFIGSSATTLTGKQKQTHYTNYFIGNDPQRWASRVGSFAAVEYTNLYEGIDLMVHQGSGHFKYDFHVAPGVSPNVIQLELEGLNSVEVRDGQLAMQTSVGEFIENRPYAFQVINGAITEVACRYVLDGTRVTFEFPNGYDSSLELIIDPELIASTLSGSSGASNYGHSATFDIAGNIYTGCISFGAGYPTTAGAFDTTHGGATDFGLSKLDPEGTNLIWASYVGGSQGEYPHSLWANDQGELYAYGNSSSSNFPTTPGAFDTSHNGGTDIVVCRLSADGTQLMGSTFIGGSAGDGLNAASQNYGDGYRGEIILDGNGKVFIASCSSSDNFPTTPGAYQSTLAGQQDAVYCRLNATLTALEASTYIGSSGNDMAYGIRMNNVGQVYIAGTAGADNFPTTAGAFQTNFIGGNGGWGGEMDGFILRMNGAGTLLQRSTLYGTDEMDQCFFIDLDSDENVFVYGQGGDFPVVGTVYSNPGSFQFITKFNADLSDVMLSTVVGSGGTGWGGTDFVPDAFLVDHCNNIYISSYQANGTLPTTPDALYTTGGFYLAVYTEDLAELEYGTFYTGNHVDGGTSRFDKNGTVYQAVCSGGGFATTPDAWATGQSNGWDIGVFKIDFDVSGVNSAITASDLSGCAPYVVQFQNFSVGDQFLWNFGDGTISTEFEPEHTYTVPGVYTVTMIASDSLSCNVADTSFFDISISTPVDYFPSFDYLMDCSTMTVTTENLTGYDFLDYIWDMGDGTIIEADNVEHIYEAPGDYIVTLTAIDNGCDSDESAEQTVTVFNEVIAVIPPGEMEGCAPFSASFTNDSPGAQYTWDFGDGSAPEVGNNVFHTYTEPGTYTLTLLAEGLGNCTGSDEATSTVVVIDPPIVDAIFEAQQTDECVLLTLEGTNLSVGDDVTYLWNFGDGTTSAETDVYHVYTSPGDYVITLTVEDQVCGNVDVATTTVTLLDQIDLSLPPNAFICYYDEAAVLEAVDPGPNTTYLWSTGETTSSIAVSEPGMYSVTAFFNNCEYTHELEVEVGPEIPTFETVKFCEGKNQYLEIPLLQRRLVFVVHRRA